MKEITEIAPGMPNARDALEGVSTAAQPGERDLGRLAEAGYRSVLDLRATGEDRGYDEAEAARRAGMEYVNLPVSPEDLGDGTFDRMRELMGDPERRPVLVHCSSGSRVGALLLPYLILDEGYSRDEAERLATEIGLSSDDLRRMALRYVEARG